MLIVVLFSQHYEIVLIAPKQAGLFILCQDLQLNCNGSCFNLFPTALDRDK